MLDLVCGKIKHAFLQVVSLGDKIKFSLSPSKSKDGLSTNVPGVPLDERNLVYEEPFLPLFLLKYVQVVFIFFHFADNKGS